VEANNAVLGAHVGRMAELGYPYGYAAITSPAFDVVSDFFRGLRGGSLDIYRNPDKLLAAVDLMQRSCIGLSIATAQITGNPRVFIPMHRGADNFMSEEAFEKFYWPTFKTLIEALVGAGLTPMPLFEGGYTSRLKYLAELPPGTVAAHFDHVDRMKFKEICGDVMCFWGNVPASLLCTGTPRQVKDDVKELIDLFGDTGTLIIDGNQGIPDEARPENVMAMREAVEEYGRL
jgi:uroporphyrinogen-III decarboxylase